MFITCHGARRKLGYLVGILALMCFLIEQYVEPTIQNTTPSLQKRDLVRIAERVLKLAIPSLYVWLLIFAGLFHVALNLCAEVTLFGDREFYKVRLAAASRRQPDVYAVSSVTHCPPPACFCMRSAEKLSMAAQDWWNAETIGGITASANAFSNVPSANPRSHLLPFIAMVLVALLWLPFAGQYWRTWNMPVHKWMLRHVFQPLLNCGVPKALAGCVVFGISGVFHELLVGVPLHMASFTYAWAFWGIMGQVRADHMWTTLACTVPSPSSVKSACTQLQHLPPAHN